MATIQRIKRQIQSSISHLEAAASGDPGRAGIAYAALHRALLELDAFAREFEGDEGREEGASAAAPSPRKAA